jgi:dihydrofolate synthase/folylpolyglutamate synthase
LANTLARNFTYRRLIVVWGSMIDKDLPATLGMIAPLADDLILTRPAGERAATPEQLLDYLSPDQKKKARAVADVTRALVAAQEAAGEDDLIAIGGSLYLIGALRHLLQGDLA